MMVMMLMIIESKTKKAADQAAAVDEMYLIVER